MGAAGAVAASSAGDAAGDGAGGDGCAPPIPPIPPKASAPAPVRWVGSGIGGKRDRADASGPSSRGSMTCGAVMWGPASRRAGSSGASIDGPPPGGAGCWGATGEPAPWDTGTWGAATGTPPSWGRGKRGATVDGRPESAVTAPSSSGDRSSVAMTWVRSRPSTPILAPATGRTSWVHWKPSQYRSLFVPSGLVYQPAGSPIPGPPLRQGGRVVRRRRLRPGTMSVG